MYTGQMVKALVFLVDGIRDGVANHIGKSYQIAIP